MGGVCFVCSCACAYAICCALDSFLCRHHVYERTHTQVLHKHIYTYTKCTKAINNYLHESLKREFVMCLHYEYANENSFLVYGYIVRFMLQLRALYRAEHGNVHNAAACGINCECVCVMCWITELERHSSSSFCAL